VSPRRGILEVKREKSAKEEEHPSAGGLREGGECYSEMGGACQRNVSDQSNQKKIVKKEIGRERVLCSRAEEVHA